jgi:hypothetical protein
LNINFFSPSEEITDTQQRSHHRSRADLRASMNWSRVAAEIGIISLPIIYLIGSSSSPRPDGLVHNSQFHSRSFTCDLLIKHYYLSMSGQHRARVISRYKFILFKRCCSADELKKKHFSKLHKSPHSGDEIRSEPKYLKLMFSSFFFVFCSIHIQ